jgi:hypothetical protein
MLAALPNAPANDQTKITFSFTEIMEIFSKLEIIIKEYHRQCIILQEVWNGNRPYFDIVSSSSNIVRNFVTIIRICLSMMSENRWERTVDYKKTA